MFYRVTNAVMAPDLTRDLSLDANTLGILGGAFFYAFALMQIPMGMLLDRVGPRLVMCGCAIIGALGAFIFALSHTLAVAVTGRVLLGIGMASALMGTLKVLVIKFPPGRFSTVSGIIVSIGTLGSVLATSPLAWLNVQIGWRATFIYAGIVTALLGLVVFFLLDEEPRGGAVQRSGMSGAAGKPAMFHSLGLVVKNLAFWQTSAASFFRYGTFVALQGLWLGPYLMEIKGLSPISAGNVLMMLSIGMITGSPVSGCLSDRIFPSTKAAALTGFAFYCLCLFPLIGLWQIDSPLIYSLICFLMGFFSGFGMLAYAHIKELFPLHMSGTAMAGVNFFLVAGGAVFMQVLGKVIQFFVQVRHIDLVEAYHFSFLICFVTMALSVIFYAFSRSGKR